jgi:hypothetical protein
MYKTTAINTAKVINPTLLNNLLFLNDLLWRADPAGGGGGWLVGLFGVLFSLSNPDSDL